MKRKFELGPRKPEKRKIPSVVWWLLALSTTGVAVGAATYHLLTTIFLESL